MANPAFALMQAIAVARCAVAELAALALRLERELNEPQLVCSWNISSRCKLPMIL